MPMKEALMASKIYLMATEEEGFKDNRVTANEL